MEITIKNLKVLEELSQETLCFSASVYVNGKKVGTAENTGHGGMTDLNLYRKKADGDWERNRELYEELKEYVPQFTWDFDGEPVPHTVDSYIDELVWKEYERKDLLKQCRNQVLFRIPGEEYKEGEYSFVRNTKFSDKVKAALEKRHGKGLYIVNEHVAR